jgi:hypothetical protein
VRQFVIVLSSWAYALVSQPDQRDRYASCHEGASAASNLRVGVPLALPVLLIPNNFDEHWRSQWHTTLKPRLEDALGSVIRFGASSEFSDFTGKSQRGRTLRRPLTYHSTYKG